mmetsp:Transcript_107442/g.310550  ORF Transcript_107442/g.310550 Transcript_107442/m.310550 type:complete len:844 (+) Transcript_107442:98-2629(+)
MTAPGVDAMVVDSAICVKGGGGVLLPLGGDSEQEWPRGLRVVLYLLGLFWCFMGVSIVADVFMAAIEKVTSKKVRLFDKTKNRHYTFEVWNSTVANLTLMALGSSAPEILLNVIDIFAKDYFLEGLGPGTIVGSAAFNLLMIIAVCIVSIPEGQVRYIKEMSVYICTASWSIFAYLWLIVILVGISPHVVEVWEGVLTFIFFPLLTFHAWACDKGWIGGRNSKDETKPLTIHEDMTADEIAEAYAEVRRQHGQQITDDQAARIMLAAGQKPRTRAGYRIQATRLMFGGKRVRLSAFDLVSTFSFLGRSSKVSPITEKPEPACMFAMLHTKLAVLENEGSVKVQVVRTGNLDIVAEVYYKTVAGTAEAGSDFESKEGWLRFEAQEAEKEVLVTIIDDNAHEADELFYVELSQATADGGQIAAISQDAAIAQITIVDDDEPGVLSFAHKDDMITVPRQLDDYVARFAIQRRQGAAGEVTVKYFTEADTALDGRDYEHVEGVLVFASNMMEAVIEVTIKGASRADASDRFRLYLLDPTGGARLDKDRDGGEERTILTASIVTDTVLQEKVSRVRAMLAKKWDKSKIGHKNWAAQFKEAISVNGGQDDDEDDEAASNPSTYDWIVHIIALPWKLVFALIPPTDYCGGWVCFFCSLIAIGIVTMLINDVASLLGCVMCIPDEITAITLVALGTSLPDTFASMTAAKSEPHADDCIGNVTGSNSVNVFLGLGLPWTIASIAWASGGSSAKWQSRYQYDADLTWLGTTGLRPQAFVVKAGSLSFGVIVFTICAIMCLTLLFVRRRVCGGELGGRSASKWASAGFLSLLWFIYIALWSWMAIRANGGGCAK